MSLYLEFTMNIVGKSRYRRVVDSGFLCQLPVLRSRSVSHSAVTGRQVFRGTLWRSGIKTHALRTLKTNTMLSSTVWRTQVHLRRRLPSRLLLIRSCASTRRIAVENLHSCVVVRLEISRKLKFPLGAYGDLFKDIDHDVHVLQADMSSDNVLSEFVGT
ncbi:hypothetical protein BKA93DRAFT_388730 [Sparassis latifolia]